MAYFQGGGEVRKTALSISGLSIHRHFHRLLRLAAGFDAAILSIVARQACSNSAGLLEFNVECMRDWLYRGSHASTSSLACRMLSRSSPCSRSTWSWSEPNSVSEQALSQQAPRLCA